MPNTLQAGTFGLFDTTTEQETVTFTTTLNLPDGEGKYAFYDAEGNKVTGQVQVSTEYQMEVTKFWGAAKNVVVKETEAEEPIILTVQGENGYVVDNTASKGRVPDDFVNTLKNLGIKDEDLNALLASRVSVEGNTVTVNPSAVNWSVDLYNIRKGLKLLGLDLGELWNYTANVSLAQSTFTVDATNCTVTPDKGTVGEDGSITTDKNANTQTVFTVAPTNGEDGTAYKVDTVTVNGDAVEVTDNQFSVNDGADATIVVTCVPDVAYTTYNVHVTGNGTIDLAGNTFTVTEGNSLTFKPTAESDSYLESVTVGGTPVEPNEDGSFTVSFTKDEDVFDIEIVFAAKQQANIVFVENGQMVYTKDAATFKQNVYNNIDFANSTLPEGLGVDNYTYWFQVNLYGVLSSTLGVDNLDQLLGSLGFLESAVEQVLNANRWVNVDEATTIGEVLNQNTITALFAKVLGNDICSQTLMPSVGQTTVKVAYTAKADEPYLSGESEGTLTITKAPASLHVGNATITYGDAFPEDLITSDPADLNKLVVYVGMDSNVNGFVSVDLPNGLIYQAVEEMYPNGFTLSQLKDVLEKLNVAVDSDVLTQILAAVPADVMNVEIHLGDQPTNTGLYLVGAVSVDGNYTTDYGIGSLVIAPQTANVSISFNGKMPNKYNLLTLEQAKTFDFSYTISEQDAVSSQSFDGVDFAGNPHHSTEPIRDIPGVYTQTVYVSGGNYYANPLIRVYVVRRADVKLSFASDWEQFVYDGAPVDLAATVTDAQGNPVDDAKVIYSYANCNGVEFNGLPTNVGTYLVTAAYFGDSQYACAVDMTIVTIRKQDLTVTLHDAVKLHGTAQDPQFTYDVDGLQGSDSVQVEITRAPGEDPGDYELTAKVTASSNYRVKVNNATLLIVDVEKPDLPDNGEVEVGNTMESVLGQELCDVINSILQGETPADVDAQTLEAVKEAIAQNKTITVELVSDQLPEDCEDSDLVKEALQEGQSVAEYLDFQIEIKADGQEIGLLTDLSRELTVTVDVPEAYQAAERSFAIIRVHGGEAMQLESTQQNNSVTFRSSEFSTYALVYADAKQEGNTGNTGNNGDNTQNTGNTQTSQTETTVTQTNTQNTAQAAAASQNETPAAAAAIPQTGDNSHPLLWGMLLVVSALGLTVLVLRKRKKHTED